MEKEPSTSQTEEESQYKSIMNSISKPVCLSRVHLDTDETPRKEWGNGIDNWAHAQFVLIPYITNHGKVKN